LYATTDAFAASISVCDMMVLLSGAWCFVR
jgi:hypothetical protein